MHTTTHELDNPSQPEVSPLFKTTPSYCGQSMNPSPRGAPANNQVLQVCGDKEQQPSVATRYGSIMKNIRVRNLSKSFFFGKHLHGCMRSAHARTSKTSELLPYSIRRTTLEYIPASIKGLCLCLPPCLCTAGSRYSTLRVCGLVYAPWVRSVMSFIFLSIHTCYTFAPKRSIFREYHAPKQRRYYRENIRHPRKNAPK